MLSVLHCLVKTVVLLKLQIFVSRLFKIIAEFSSRLAAMCNKNSTVLDMLRNMGFVAKPQLQLQLQHRKFMEIFVH